MTFADAFWDVINRLFKIRPIILGCCDCGETYYLTANRTNGYLEDDNGNSTPVVKCPFCGLEHAVFMERLDEDTTHLRVEITQT